MLQPPVLENFRKSSPSKHDASSSQVLLPFSSFLFARPLKRVLFLSSLSPFRISLLSFDLWTVLAMSSYDFFEVSFFDDIFVFWFLDAWPPKHGLFSLCGSLHRVIPVILSSSPTLLFGRKNAGRQIKILPILSVPTHLPLTLGYKSLVVFFDF